jgi:hypothetical protein
MASLRENSYTQAHTQHAHTHTHTQHAHTRMAWASKADVQNAGAEVCGACKHKDMARTAFNSTSSMNSMSSNICCGTHTAAPTANPGQSHRTTISDNAWGDGRPGDAGIGKGTEVKTQTSKREHDEKNPESRCTHQPAPQRHVHGLGIVQLGHWVHSGEDFHLLCLSIGRLGWGGGGGGGGVDVAVHNHAAPRSRTADSTAQALG